MAKRVLFLFPYPEGTAASQRFRFEQYYPALKKAGFTIHKQAFIDDKTWQILYKPGYTFTKIVGTLKGYLRRMGAMFSLGKYDYVFVHREAEFFGPPIFEWIIIKLAGKKLIYDKQKKTFKVQRPVKYRPNKDTDLGFEFGESGMIKH